MLVRICSVVLVALVVIPLCMIIYGTFVTEAPPGRDRSPTLEHYKVLLDPGFLVSLRNSVVAAVLTTSFAMLIGGSLALAMVRTRLPMRRLFSATVVMPAYVSPFIGAIAWTLLLSPNIGYVNNVLASIGLPRLNIYSIWGIAWVSGLYMAPMAYLYLTPALLSFDRSFEEAGRATGASPIQTMRRIAIPILKPAALSSILIVFVQAIGDFAVPAVLGVPGGIRFITTEIVRMTAVFPSDRSGAAVIGLFLGVITIAILGVNTRLTRKHDYITVTSRGVTTSKSQSPTWRWIAFAGFLTYTLAAVVLPVLVMIVASFQPFLSTNLTAAGFTLDNYRFVLNYPAIVRALRNSILLSLATALITTVLAIGIGYIVARTRATGRRTIDYLSTMPLGLPHTMFGLAVLWTWLIIPAGVYGSIWILLIAYIPLFLPYSVRAAVAAFQQIDPSLEDAARINGAAWLTSVRKVVAPLLAPALLGGATLVIYHAVRELSASLLLYTAGNEVISVSIWSMLSEGQYVQLFALSVINLALVAALVAVVGWVMKKVNPAVSQ